MKFNQSLGLPKELFPQEMGLQKLKVFNHRCWTHEIFRVCQYKEELNFDKIWGTKMGPSSNRATKFLNF